jgi:hypothetical protein
MPVQGRYRKKVKEGKPGVYVAENRQKSELDMV